MLRSLANAGAVDHRAQGQVACRGCRSTTQRPLGYKNGYELMECAACGNVSTELQPDESVRAEIFEPYYEEASFETPEVTARSLDRLVTSLEPCRRTERWLDIGYGAGGLLSAAERQGWDCYGTEIAVKPLEYGRGRGWVVTDTADRDPRFPKHGFDIVTMIEFLEHVPEPEEFLRSALRWLRPGGILYLTTPNAQSINYRLLGLEWSIFCPPDHITIWTVRGLRTALNGAGFRCQRIRTEGLNPCEIFARFGRKSNNAAINRQQAAENLNSAFSRSPFRRTVKRSINGFLSALRAGDGLKVWATPASPVILEDEQESGTRNGPKLLSPLARSRNCI